MRSGSPRDLLQGYLTTRVSWYPTSRVPYSVDLQWNDLTMSKVGWPTFWHLHPGVRKREELSLGERAADRMRNIMGSWPFVFSFFGVMILWAAGNTYFFSG